MQPDDRLRWIKSSHSTGDENCVEVTRRPDGSIGVRDSKIDDHSPILTVTRDEWAAFLAGARNGEFDNLAH